MLMRRMIVCGAASLLLAGHGAANAAAAGGGTALESGLDKASVDGAIRPQDDLYRYFNGKWLDSFAIPEDKGGFSQFDVISDRIEGQLRGIVEGLAHAAAAPGPEARKIADLYASFLDEARLEKLGALPLGERFAKIDVLERKVVGVVECALTFSVDVIDVAAGH